MMIRSGPMTNRTGKSHLPPCPSRQALLSARPNAALAQLVEHRIRNARVTCSSHVSGTITPSASIHFRLKKRRKSAKIRSFWSGAFVAVHACPFPIGGIGKGYEAKA